MVEQGHLHYCKYDLSSKSFLSIDVNYWVNTEDKVFKWINLNEARVQMFSSDKQDPENLLSDQTKISGSIWVELKKQAMEPDYIEKS